MMLRYIQLGLACLLPASCYLVYLEHCKNASFKPMGHTGVKAYFIPYANPAHQTFSSSFNILFISQHILSIPFFVMLGLLPEVRAGFQTSFLPLYIKGQGIYAPAASAVAVLLVNLLTQDMCVKGVNRLTTVRHPSVLLKISIN